MNIIQIPNLQLIVALTALLVSKISSGLIQSASLTIYTIAIIIWAYLEITSGINWLRRLLGLAVLLMIAYSLFNQLS